jgi:xanthine dehydrogenase accessory factor
MATSKVEGDVITEAQGIIAGGGHKVLSYGVADETAWKVGLACGGKIRVLVEAVT